MNRVLVPFSNIELCTKSALIGNLIHSWFQFQSLVKNIIFRKQNPDKWDKQVGAELGHAQIKLEWDFTSINLH